MINNDQQDVMLDLDQGFQIDKYWKIIKPKLHFVIAITLLMVVGAWIKTSMRTPLYRATGLLMIEPENTNVVNFGDRLTGYDYRNEYLNTQINILNSRSLKRSVIDEITSTGDTAVGVLSVAPVEFTRLINVSYSSPDAKMAARLVNTLFDKFIEFNLDVKTQSSKQTSEFIGRQIRNLQRSLAQKEEELQEYGKRKDLFYLSRSESTVVEKFSDYNKAYTQAQINRVNKEAFYNGLKAMKFEDYPEVKNDALISNLKVQYSSLEADYRKKSQLFRESYPEMIQLRSQMETLMQRIRKEIRDKAMKTLKEARTEFESAKKREESLLELLNNQKKDMVNSNTAAIYYRSLDIERTNLRNLLNYLVRKQEESLVTSRMEGLQTSNIKIIDRAEIPQYPYNLGKTRTLLMALILGLSISIGLIFLLDFLDRSIKTPEEVKTLLRVPALGVIPSSNTKSVNRYYSYNYHSGKKDKKKDQKPKSIELINHKEPDSHFSELYRTVRTSILLSTPKMPPKVIAISSALPNEGKTVSCINLAISFTQLGKKVLVLDGDLRKPRMHKILNLKNTPGLSTYLVGRAKLPDIIYKTHIPNLYVIPSGPISPNPAELIDSEVMANILVKFNQEVDFIFIDTPPLIGLVDPILVGKHSDGMILVTWGGKTNRDVVEKAKEELAQFNIRLLGVILNKIDFKREKYANYYYQYRYKYKEDEEDSTRSGDKSIYN
jgi:capsular exopolysaccharide synthesis family protein